MYILRTRNRTTQNNKMPKMRNMHKMQLNILETTEEQLEEEIDIKPENLEIDFKKEIKIKIWQIILIFLIGIIIGYKVI